MFQRVISIFTIILLILNYVCDIINIVLQIDIVSQLSNNYTQ